MPLQLDPAAIAAEEMRKRFWGREELYKPGSAALANLGPLRVSRWMLSNLSYAIPRVFSSIVATATASWSSRVFVLLSGTVSANVREGQG